MDRLELRGKSDGWYDFARNAAGRKDWQRPCTPTGVDLQQPATASWCARDLSALTFR
jgi:hypothetical protein